MVFGNDTTEHALIQLVNYFTRDILLSRAEYFFSSW